MLPILGSEDHGLNDDEECAARQMVRHVCVALKKYMESHLFLKYSQMTRLNDPSASALPAQPIFKVSQSVYFQKPRPHNSANMLLFELQTPKCTPEIINDQVTALQEMLPVRASWEPVDKLLSLNGIQLLLRIIAYSYEWNYSGR